jgi:hypothetical protein
MTTLTINSLPAPKKVSCSRSHVTSKENCTTHCPILRLPLPRMALFLLLLRPQVRAILMMSPLFPVLVTLSSFLEETVVSKMTVSPSFNKKKMLRHWPQQAAYPTILTTVHQWRRSLRHF